VLRAAKDLAKPLTKKKITPAAPTHHEHEAKWEIPNHSSVANHRAAELIIGEEHPK